MCLLRCLRNPQKFHLMALFSFLLPLKQQGMFYVCWAQFEKPGCATDICVFLSFSVPGHQETGRLTNNKNMHYILFLKNHYA